MLKELTREAFVAFCRAHGMKCTAQRLAVFSAIRLSRSHPSVDETLSVVRKTLPTVTRDSVYRILNEFVSLGLVSRVDALTAARYDTCIAPHAHFICEVCGRISDYPIPAGFALPVGMPAERHHIEIRVTGVCDMCSQKPRA